LRARRLHTVRIGALPEMHECFIRGAATFMYSRKPVHARAAVFVRTQRFGAKQEFRSIPKSRARAEMAARMKLRYVVITSVIATIWRTV